MSALSLGGEPLNKAKSFNMTEKLSTTNNSGLTTGEEDNGSMDTTKPYEADGQSDIKTAKDNFKRNK